MRSSYVVLVLGRGVFRPPCAKHAPRRFGAERALSIILLITVIGNPAYQTYCKHQTR
ncbi:hypothetical protein GCM10018793_70970 [Streptomyces sulfonofaciens]|uniref:Uncharacterized protein n=1 Tax=Streptomyces sulfonofaciens TaxID=68272 RepID=A0A919GQS7_9ACTN|nr:hypothetical protein GCM10018793_70970 [Streptomyces sulfonofaciens]